jgi:magnesium transporter
MRRTGVTDVPDHNIVFGTASEHLARVVPVVSPDATAAAARQLLEKNRYESAAQIAVCDGRHLLGVIKIEDLFASEDDMQVRQLMDAQPPVVAPGTDQEVAAWQAVRHGESTLAVVDESGGFLGFIPPHRLLAVLLHEHEEDLARLGGFLRGVSGARAASEEPVIERLWHRLPWLGIGLAGALLAANVMGGFAAHLEEHVVVAFFVPAIVYLADAVGTQTEAVVIRGLSLGITIRHVLWREILTGALVGLALAAASFPFVLLRWGEVDVAWTVALSLLAACSTATIVALMLPWALHRLGRDPAFGSGPLATVIQDLLSIIIYLSISTALVG